MTKPHIKACLLWTQLLSLSVLALSVALLGQANPPQPTGNVNANSAVQGRLEFGKAIRNELGEGQSHSYIFALEAGQYACVVVSVSQPNIGSVLKLLSMDGKEVVLELNYAGVRGRGWGWREPLCWIAVGSGDYRLELSAARKGAVLAKYEIKLNELRAATAEDKQRIVLQNLLQEARASMAKTQYQQASGTLERALALSREVKDRESEAAALGAIGFAYASLSQQEKAIAYYEQALTIEREIRDRRGEGLVLNYIGTAYDNLDQHEKAIGYTEQALEIHRAVSDHQGESVALSNLGNAYSGLSQFEKAINYYEQSLILRREAKDRRGEAAVLNNLAIAYRSLSQYEKAISYYEQSLTIVREGNDQRAEGAILNNLGNTYIFLNQYEKAILYYEQALAMRRDAQDRQGEGATLIGLGGAFFFLEQFDKAMSSFEQANVIAREIKDRHSEAVSLTNEASVYESRAQYEKAIDYYGQALAINREIKDRQEEGEVLSHLGSVSGELAQYAAAIKYFEEALAIRREIKDRQGEGLTLADFMEMWKAYRKPRLAIFYGKQAVNTVQSIRSDIGGLSPELQKSFLKGNEKPYHTLAELLIAQGRLVEAEQVLNLLKEEEYFEFVRRDGKEASSLKNRSDLTADEAEWEKRYREIGEQMVALGTERGELLNKKSLTPEDTKRLAQLDQDLAVGNAAFEKFLNELSEHFGTTPEVSAKVEQLRETQGIMEDLRELPKGTVAIYTLVGEDKYRAILITPDVQKAYEYPIKAADLNRKILGFRQVIENPRLDPRPLGQELYKILLANMAQDLRQAHAKTVMWSLDGALRYLPIAALHDGKQYLIEQYALSVFTPASNARLKDRPDRDWKAAGFGVTKAYEGAPALPGVASELTSIIESKLGQGGILVGEIKLDDQFSEDAMRQTLLKHYTVVHIASHFRFQPGNETNSFLLLGDGNHLSLTELKTLPNLFGGVQLLTLSACNTGLGDNGNGNGKEVEGFGVLAQRKGAKAVVASLWSVADVSTGLFMQKFYRVRESSGVTKLEALRQAQLALLRGTVKVSEDAEDTKGRRALVQEEVASNGVLSAPAFVADPKAPYAHPFYWAPFFLMGNWL
jgi:CHAT domain-containing protein/tetratricopeptide (TPR) repeat protein